MSYINRPKEFSRLAWLPLLLLICIIQPVLSPAYGQKQKDIINELTPAQKDWLEIVTPIITGAEKEVFFKLKTEQERDRFISLFWKVRDPNPDTNENEFYREYLERVHFADRYFGIGSSKRGCLTERGYYYLLLGKPRERQVYATQSDIWPMELWFYQGDPKYGLPGYFYLLFYQPEGSGDYRLYYPGVEGPEKLVIPSMSSAQLNRSKALEVIKAINAELAKAAISYLPEEQQDGFSSLTSQTIIATIKSLPEKKFPSAYVKNYLSYKDLVEVDYSHNFINSNAVARVFPEGQHYFVHWSIEPDKINFAEVNGVYSATYELTVRLEDSAGQPVLSRTEEVPLRLNREQFQARSRQRLAFQDLFPVLPGEYKLLILLKNKTARDFTSWETSLKVPGTDSGRFLSPLVLYHAASPLQAGRVKAFSFKGQEYLVSARNEFSPTEKLQVLCWLLSDRGWPAEARVQLCLRSLDSEASPECRTVLLKEALQPGNILRLEPVDLGQVRPGYYRVEVSLIDGNKTLETVRENLIVLSQPALTAPWVLGRVHGAMPSPDFLRMLAGQHFLKGNYQEARKILEEILASRDEPESRLLLARTLLALGDYRGSLSAALAVYETNRDREAAKVIALDYVRLKDWASARGYVDGLLAEATEVSVLNLAAEVYQNLGEREQAIKFLEKSLSLLPDQPAIKSWLDDLKRKK
ncbi:MAG: GWxTD domain-containing protein [Candidatus Saccharicenans sp.]|jgi:GWxTD domain-containing protein|nr:GWxTD domain-containing protein [Candidatus Saccharicenans sp.]MDH7576019.1 GWxTD domain-containing protein [Candidatus Saccharicenans sp.]